MPFEIVRNDLTNMQADAIVNAANPKPVIGYGVDSAIHRKAGRRLLTARKKEGMISFGEAAITPAYNLDARYVIHTATPVWQGGNCQEEKLLRACYQNSLKLALKYNCESIAFPLLASGNHGFPKELALHTAINVFSSFLMKHDMQIYLVVFDRSSFVLSEKLFASVQSHIDDTYILENCGYEYGLHTAENVRDFRELPFRESTIRCPNSDIMDDAPVPKLSAPLLKPCAPSAPAMAAPSVPAPSASSARKLEDLMKEVDSTFSETLIRLIDRKGLKDSEVYKKANIDRKLFSKIKNNPYYKPGKVTAIAFAIALELSLDETKDFIRKAGYALTHSSKFDIIIEYFLLEKKYDIFEINETLFAFDQPLIGS